MSSNLLRATGLGVGLLLTTGCLVKQETHTWYVDARGSVVWEVMERDVRSDANAALDRDREEGMYWTAVQAGQHDMARGLRLIGAEEVRTRVVRANVPFTVVTEGAFRGLDLMAQALITHLGLAGSSAVTRTGDAWEWTMSVRDPGTDPAPRGDEAVMALAGAFEQLRIVLVAGRFEDVEGWHVSSDRRVATIDRKALEDAGASTVVLKARWRATR